MFTTTGPVLNEQTGTNEADWAGLRGDTLYFTISKDPLADWDNRIWTAQVRVTAADTEIAQSFEVTDNSTSSLVSVFFKLNTDDLLGRWFYDVQWNDPDTDFTETILMGKLKIKQDVTRA